MSSIPTTSSLFIKNFFSNKEELQKKVSLLSDVNQKNRFPLPPASSEKKWKQIKERKEALSKQTVAPKKEEKKFVAPKKEVKTDSDAKKKFVRAQQILKTL